jgi:lipoprotein-anchoring transpeptidase ErfK/SrfK
MRLRRYILVPVAAVLALSAPAPAAGQDAPTVTLETAGTESFERGLVSLARKRVSALARVAGAPVGSTLTLTFVHRGRTVKTVRRPVSGAGEAAGFVTPAIGGPLSIRARLTAPTGGGASGGGTSNAGDRASAGVRVLTPTSNVGDHGPSVRWLQRKLAAMRYAVRLTGVHDVHTSYAVIAYRKVLGATRIGNASRGIFYAAAAGRGAYAARFPGAGRHVEADLDRQVLALVDPGGSVARVYHTSSGRPRFKTPTGVHRFWRKEYGLNSRSMLHTVYFTHDKTTRPTRPACGIHGYFAVPTYPNSHCCLRVSLSDALYIFRWTRVGERIHVYRG